MAIHLLASFLHWSDLPDARVPAALACRCRSCHGRLQRTRRTLRQRLWLLAVYQCQSCGQTQYTIRPWCLYLSPFARCPRCDTARLKQLVGRDGIDRLHRGLLGLAARLRHGRLFHCCFCRLQFYDCRDLAPESQKRLKEN